MKYHEEALKIIGHASDPALCQCECLAGKLCNLHKAEALLQKALVADVRYGPAHNTLGMLYFYQHKLYLAAWEFDHASRLMPDYAEPLNNLGLTYEAAERLDPAIGYYQMALELCPTNPVYIGNLAKARMRQGANVDEVRGLLQELVFYDSRQEWIAWARDNMGLHPIQVASAECSEELPNGVEQPTSENLPPPSLPEPVPSQSLQQFGPIEYSEAIGPELEPIGD